MTQLQLCFDVLEPTGGNVESTVTQLQHNYNFIIVMMAYVVITIMIKIIILWHTQNR